jgi:hypothetical protein
VIGTVWPGCVPGHLRRSAASVDQHLGVGGTGVRDAPDQRSRSSLPLHSRAIEVGEASWSGAI